MVRELRERQFDYETDPPSAPAGTAVPRVSSASSVTMSIPRKGVAPMMALPGKTRASGSEPD